ncbi:MAG: TonB-dependent receptor [Gemmatimonadales bacterium]|nr:TonB-dependent receptor [Gemmatimonadales bacterium]
MRLCRALALVSLWTLPCAPLALGQGAVVRGTVRDAVSGAAVPAAEVMLVPGSRRAVTDGDGRFALPVPADGAVALLVRRPGYAPTRLRLAAASAEPIEVTLAPATTILDPVVTVATRDARSLADVPAALAVADSIAIVFGRTVGLHEALRSIPGVLAASRSGGDDLNLAIRGSSGARPTNGVRGVAVHLDGVPLNEADGAARLDLIELSAARQVEVLRGPASALYGGAVGGVINVVSRTGAENRGIVARAQRGAFGFEKYDVYAGAPTADGRGGLNGNAAYTWSEGFRDRSETRFWRATPTRRRRSPPAGDSAAWTSAGAQAFACCRAWARPARRRPTCTTVAGRSSSPDRCRWSSSTPSAPRRGPARGRRGPSGCRST